MKVLHINCNYLTTALHQTMIETLDKQGIENTVFAPTYNKKLAIINPNDHVIVKECFRKRDRYNFWHKQNKIISSIENSVKVDEYDCIHAYTLFTDGNSAYELSSEYNIPYIVAVRNTDVNIFLKYFVPLRKRGINILKSASAIVFLSPSYKKLVYEKYIPDGIKREIVNKTYVIPNGINALWYQGTPKRDYASVIKRIKSKYLKVIYVGRVNRHKNITATQEALQELRKEGWHTEFLVVGNIDDKQEYRKLIKDSNTSYLPRKSMSEIIELYKEYDMLIMPSHTETFGLVYAEAMSQGLPVIYTKGQGFDEQFPDGKVGYAVDDRNPRTIKEAIIKIITNYEDISQAAIHGAEQFKWDSICGEYRKIYSAI